MKIFFTTWQGLTLVAGGVVIIALALVLFFMPAPQHIADAPTSDTMPTRGDTIDQALEGSGSARVAFGPLYASFGDSEQEYGVLIMASEDADDMTRYQLAIAGARASDQENATYIFGEGVIPRDLSVSAGGSIVVSVRVEEGEADALRFTFESGAIAVESTYDE